MTDAKAIGRLLERNALLKDKSEEGGLFGLTRMIDSASTSPIEHERTPALRILATPSARAR